METTQTTATTETQNTAPKFDAEQHLQPVWIKTSELLQKLNMSRSMLSKLQSAGKFPEPIRFGGNVYRWNLAEIDEWIETALKNKAI